MSAPLIVVTFILACRGVSSSNTNAGMLTQMNKAVDSISKAGTALEQMVKDKEIANKKNFGGNDW